MVNKLKEEHKWTGLWHKAKVFGMICATAIASVFSSCSNKTVDEQVRDIIEDKQEVVDDLKDDKRDLQEDIRKKDIELSEAEKQLREAKRLKHK